MGFHKTSASRNMRTPHAHLERKENGDVYGVYKLGFSNNAPRFEYCFIGEQLGTLAYNGKTIEKHPKFNSIKPFERWCSRYVAENDL